MITAAFFVLLAAAIGFAYRLARGPSLADRVVAVDGLLIVGVAAIATDAMRTGRGAYLPVAAVITLVSFVGTAIVGRYLEGRGS